MTFLDFIFSLVMSATLVTGCDGGDDNDNGDTDSSDTDADSDTDSDTSDWEPCYSPETWRCNGDVVETCRMVSGGFYFWCPMEDCSHINGGVCEDPGDGTEPFCTGNYWDSGYCPGTDKPAAPDCRGITAVGCCNEELQMSLRCDEATGKLFCIRCWADSYYSEYCTWDDAEYSCSYLENGAADITEDPSGENPISCPGT